MASVIDPAQAVPLTRPGNAARKQYLSGQTGGPKAGFEFQGIESWVNEWEFPTRMKFDAPWEIYYLQNRCMSLFSLNPVLQT